MGGDTGEGGAHRPVGFGGSGHRDLPGRGVEDELPESVPLGERHGGRHGGVTTERNLGERAEVPHPKAAFGIVPRHDERRLRVTDLGGEGQHPGGIEPGRVEHDPGGVAAVIAGPLRGEGGVAQNVGAGFETHGCTLPRVGTLEKRQRTAADDESGDRHPPLSHHFITELFGLSRCVRALVRIASCAPLV